MKIVFFGTPEYVVPIADKVNKAFRSKKSKGIAAVVTQKPKPSGRDKKITRSEVDHWAYKHKIPIKFEFDDIPKADLGIVASFGKIIPKSVIDKFTYGLLNVHPSLLPEFRGASPVQAQLVKGVKTCGVTIIKMDEKLDHGPIVSAFKEDVLKDDTSETLRNRLFEKTSDFLVPLLKAYNEGKILPKSQNHDLATFTRTISKEDGFIKPNYLENALEGKETNSKWEIGFISEYSQKPNPENIERFIRAMDPWPIAWTTIEVNGEDRRLKLLKSHLEGGKLVLDEVQLEGKNKVSWKSFKHGYPKAKFI